MEFIGYAYNLTSWRDMSNRDVPIGEIVKLYKNGSETYFYYLNGDLIWHNNFDKLDLRHHFDMIPSCKENNRYINLLYG